ncbi:unnamed protein product, partial [Amoebophrya sp. A120]
LKRIHSIKYNSVGLGECESQSHQSTTPVENGKPSPPGFRREDGGFPVPPLLASRHVFPSASGFGKFARKI